MKQSKQFTSMIISLLFLSFIFTGCATKKETTQNDQLVINNILVFPTDISANQKHSATGKSTKDLEPGREILNQKIKQYFANNNKVAFISRERQETLLKGYNKDRLHQAISVGEQLKVDAVLVSQIERYRERQGKEYAVIKPAALSFKYRLLGISSGQTLCVGSYDVSQKPWTENILSFKKTMSRGGKWIKAEELATEAVNEKFSSCQYFK